MRSSMTSSTPIWPSSSIVVVTSCRCGTLLIVTGPSASNVAARIGSTAFLAPDIATSPVSGWPPLMRIFAIGVGIEGWGLGTRNRDAKTGCGTEVIGAEGARNRGAGGDVVGS
jgi:hypothetical protein